MNVLFPGLWLPQIKRWALFYRPVDLMWVNTNNGTERLNESLKYDDLESHKRCSLSELLTIIVERFLQGFMIITAKCHLFIWLHEIPSKQHRANLAK